MVRALMAFVAFFSCPSPPTTTWPGSCSAAALPTLPRRFARAGSHTGDRRSWCAPQQPPHHHPTAVAAAACAPPPHVACPGAVVPVSSRFHAPPFIVVFLCDIIACCPPAPPAYTYYPLPVVRPWRVPRTTHHHPRPPPCCYRVDSTTPRC